MPSAPERPFASLSPFEQRLKLLSEREGKKPAQLVPGLSTDTVNKWRREAAAGKPPPRGDALHAFATALGVTVDWLLDPTPISRDAGLSSGNEEPAPVRTVELDTHRDRLWIRAGLIQAGFDRGIASDVALSVQFKDAQSPEAVLEGAKQIARLAVAESKGKLITGRQETHPAEPPPVGDFDKAVGKRKPRAGK